MQKAARLSATIPFRLGEFEGMTQNRLSLPSQEYRSSPANGGSIKTAIDDFFRAASPELIRRRLDALPAACCVLK